jgi:hypothetical protein
MTKLFLSAFLIFALSASAFAASPASVHTFYYNWYGNLETDGAWRQWNHQIATPEGGRHVPPEDIGASFYPAGGLYSANDPKAVDLQMVQMKKAGIDVASVTWWGIGYYSDKALDVLFAAAEKHGIKVCFHIEPFGGRNATTTRAALVYLLDKYGDHPALFRDSQRNNLPYFYIYDSYLVPAAEWATILKPDGAQTIRGTKYDAVMIGLWVKEKDGAFMSAGGFDGYYTYFATEGFTYGSSPENWPTLMDYAQKNGLFFIPCVGPGYEDLQIRPWNGVNFRDREDGAYYDRMFKAALDCGARTVAVTSWNEWHEGTQIEAAVPKKTPDYTYLDYQSRKPDWYLHRTKHWAEKLNLE